MCFGTEEQGGAAQSVNLVKEHAHDTSLPQANAIFGEKQNVTLWVTLCMLQIRSTYDYDKVLNVLQTSDTCWKTKQNR